MTQPLLEKTLPEGSRPRPLAAVGDHCNYTGETMEARKSFVLALAGELPSEDSSELTCLRRKESTQGPAAHCTSFREPGERHA